MRSILKYLTWRLVTIALVILIQLALLVMLFTGLWNCSIYVQAILRLISIAFAIAVLNSDSNPAFKLSWIFLILILPLGWILYITFHGTCASKKEVLKYSDCIDLTSKYNILDDIALEEVTKESPEFAKLCKYVQNTSQMGVFKDTYTKFYPCGEYFFVDYVESLKSAKKYIFLEYFIISHGVMWDTVLEILKDKANHGVEVRLMYDDMGTISLIKRHYDDYLNTLGIKTVVFNRIKAFPNPSINFRDHRKMTIIDGTIAYTGGLNLSDEYINEKERFGYWKDSAIKIQGNGVKSMVLMYLQLWNYSSYDDRNSNLEKYFSNEGCKADGYVQSFYDDPFSKSLISENVYMGIINNAKNYVYICTPYLIIDNEMLMALKFASTSGVDVRIITPSIPDKKNVNEVTRSNYVELLKSGVRIFEFKDGFIHSKTIVSDDVCAMVGTANFDFRSFYMHFENNILMYNTTAVMEVKADCVDIFNNVSNEIKYQDSINISIIQKITRFILRLFSPMM
ncbi:MAG: cardiolipin synthase [Ruminococcus sp.]|nr:cardiolipin synthase [Ruminococcus sp.]MCD7799931.1 cardiolipin synthase [Ruminococcus sp.]